VGRELYGLKNATTTGLNMFRRSPFASKDAGRYRRFEWTRFDLDEVKRIRTAVGGTVNDVLVAATAGAARRYLRRDGVDVADLESLRTVLPVHTGGAQRRKTSGNRVAMLLADLPLEPSSPSERLKQVVELTSHLKDQSHQSEGVQFVEDIADATVGGLLAELIKFASHMEAFDLILTNIPGPQMPLYMMSARLESVYPVVPLMPRQTLGIALFSYDGSVFWGIQADREAFPDLPRFVADLEASYRALRREANLELAEAGTGRAAGSIAQTAQP
jgi:WS/DGAT/MGAT family acyltransferase